MDLPAQPGGVRLVAASHRGVCYGNDENDSTGLHSAVYFAIKLGPSPLFPCITLPGTAFQAFLEWRCPSSSSGPWRQAASRLWQTGPDPKPCSPLTTVPPNALELIPLSIQRTAPQRPQQPLSPA